MNETRQLTLNGANYVITFAPATIALRAGARVANMIGVASGRATSIESALAAALASPDLGDHLDALCAAFAPSTQVVVTGPDGRPRSFTLAAAFDVHFQGKLGDLVQWLAAALEHNLSSFFDAIPALAARVGAAVAAPSKSPTPSETSG